MKMILGLIAGLLLLQTNLDIIRTGIISLLTSVLQGLSIFLDSFRILADIGLDLITGNFDGALKGILTLFINLWNSIAIGFEGVFNGVIAMVNTLIRRINPVLTALGKDTIKIISDAKFTVEMFDYTPTTYDPSAQYRINTGGGVGDIGETLKGGGVGNIGEPITDGDNTTNLLEQLLSAIEAGFATEQDVVLKMDSTEVARATLPKLNKEASRQGYKPLLEN